jgi:hypothetical protein
MYAYVCIFVCIYIYANVYLYINEMKDNNINGTMEEYYKLLKLPVKLYSII